MNRFQFLADRLREREEKGLRRTLLTTEGRVDFTSNDYLGLARSAELARRIETKIASLSLPAGATGSRLLSGNMPYMEAVEQKLAGLFDAPRALVFNSGYIANAGVLSALPSRGDTILYDERAHASIKDGARLSAARRFSFAHNDLDDLARKIRRAEGNVYVAAESLYSMDGDFCPLQEMTALTQSTGAILVLDEAHTTGMYGPGGSGYAVSLRLQHAVDIRIYTFGKAVGLHGACVVGDPAMIDYLINFSRPFIYTTALSPHSFAAIACAFEFLGDHEALFSELRERIVHYTQEVAALGDRAAAGPGAIQTLRVPGNHRARSVAQQVQQAGFDVRAILSPTVPEGAERLRIILHAFNSKEEISALVATLRATL